MQLMIKRGGHQRRHLWKSSVLHSSWKKYTFYPISWRYSLKFNAKEVSIVNALSEGAVSAVLPWVFRYHAINLCTKWYSLHTLYVLLWQDVANRKPSVCSTVGRSAKYISELIISFLSNSRNIRTQGNGCIMKNNWKTGKEICPCFIAWFFEWFWYRILPFQFYFGFLCLKTSLKRYDEN